MYVLTPCRHDSDRSHWTAFAYDDPDAGEAILLAFRMEEAGSDTFTAKLPFAVPGETYKLRNADTEEVFEADGARLRDGLTLTLREKKTSALIYINRK